MTSLLPFSPLTLSELDARQASAMWGAVVDLTFSDRRGGSTLLEDAEAALPAARRAMEYHEAAMARCR